MPASPVRFADIVGVDARLAAVLERREMIHAFPVQAAVIPAGIEGRDLLVQSPTGSGKTLAFGIPIIERLERDTKSPAAIILVPTRELAVQVAADLAPIATGKQLRVIAVYGGSPIHIQSKQAKDAAIIVATPGRLDDMMRQRKIDLRGVRTLVLDEADRMLDMGFQPQVDAIADQLPNQRQTMLFSATLEGRVAVAAASYTNDPKVVTVDTAAVGEGGKIQHVIWNTTGGIKVDTVLEALEMERDLAVVFVRTKRSADTLMGRLREHGVRATAIHGGMTQRERLNEYKRFQEAQCDVLVATDVFARGMDLDRITLVVNYDVPEDADTYRHRTGRTGRAGRTGTAVTLMTGAQRKQLRRMIREAGIEMSVFDDVRNTKRTRREPLPESQHFSPAPNRPARPAGNGAKPPFSRGHGGARPGARPEARGTYGRKQGNPGSAGGTGKGGGLVVSYDPAKGFGFITPERGGPDVFFHRKAIGGDCDPAELRKGAKVAYEAQQHDRGVRASDVRLLEAARS
ncbi:MAG: box helicase domain protein [Thermoleophilia bacterium]|nr:box helicase domain protein [Thermoleophilia bacterium]